MKCKADAIRSSVMIEDVKQLCKAGGNKAIAHFYFDFNDPNMGMVANFLRSIIAQLAGRKPVLPEAVRGLYDEYIQSRQQPDKRTLVATATSIIGSYENCYIVLDALDECGSTENRKEVLHVLRTLLMTKATGGFLHLLATSRNEPDIQKALEPIVFAQILMDIAKVDEDDRLKGRPVPIKKEIINNLVQKAHGMWVRLNVGIISEVLQN